jgi:hypothetical protein
MLERTERNGEIIMKELSVEQKAKRYDEVVAMAKECITYIPDEAVNEYMLNMFPELKESKAGKPNGGIVSEDFNEGDGFYKVNLAYLSQEQVEEIENIVKKWNTKIKESEDDRVRKLLIDYLKERRSCYFKERKSCGHQYLLRYDHWINWLEKQGEQNPTWSEYDEVMLHSIISDFKGFKHDNTSSLAPHFDNCIAWVKSLKDRATWKPTEEQINAIRLARSFVTDDSSDNPTLSEILLKLEKQLKKLTFCSPKNFR